MSERDAVTISNNSGAAVAVFLRALGVVGMFGGVALGGLLLSDGLDPVVSIAVGVAAFANAAVVYAVGAGLDYLRGIFTIAWMNRGRPLPEE